MPKHLTRIEPVVALPDPVDLPDGYPVLFEGGIWVKDPDSGLMTQTGGGAGASAVFETVSLPHTTGSSQSYLDWAFDAAYTQHADGGGIIEIDPLDATLIQVTDGGVYSAEVFMRAGAGGVANQSYEAVIWFDWDDQLFGDFFKMPGGPNERGWAQFTHRLDAGEKFAVGVRNGAGTATDVAAASLYVNKIG